MNEPPGRSRSPSSKAKPHSPRKAGSKQQPSSSRPASVRSSHTAAGFGKRHQQPQGLQFLESESSTSDSSIELTWEQVKIGPNVSYTVKIHVPSGQPVEASVTQAHYSKTVKGIDGLVIGPIPVADVDVQGHLRITNLASGAAAETRWVWRPLSRMNKTLSSTILKTLMKPLQRRKNKSARPKNESAKAAQSSQANAVSKEKQARIQFFGIEARGGCFAFILDISLSMHGSRLEYCKRELAQAINSLPEHSSFGVFLYADDVYVPNGQSDWMLAKPSVVQNINKWVASINVKPFTRPAPAFKRALSYSAIPSVIYFLTDGELFDFSARDCANITGAKNSLAGTVSGWFVNRDPKPVPVIHTIALGNEASADVLQEIANDHGGVCVAIDSA